MRKILYVFLLILVSCTPKESGGIHGEWSRKAKAQQSEEIFSYSLIFNTDGTYTNIISQDKTIWSSESGQYYYIGDEDGFLYLFNRSIDSFHSQDTLKYKVHLDNENLYLFINAGVYQYHR